MRLTIIDWLVIGAYFALNVGIGFYYKSRASKSISEFFLSGRNVPWWLAGTSMVATTFAADTPLVVTGLVAKNGIAGNWIWWSFLMSGMLTVFFYARLWRRAGVMTDIEFAEIRYSGKPAAFLRGFRAVYLGVFINCIILGWVNLAMVKILGLIFGVGKFEALLIVLGLIALTSAISTLSGLWGVLVTDMVQFVIKMGMVIVLAVFAINAVGGIESMKSQLVATGRSEALNLIPNLNSAWMPMITFLVYISLNWWATWYPGAEPGGGGYVAQRMFSAKDDVQREGRATFDARDALVQHRALRDPAVAVDSRRARLADPLSRAQGSRDRLHPRADRPSPGVAARPDDRCVRRGVHVHDRNAAELGRELSHQ